jgi:hypothetical protein
MSISFDTFWLRLQTIFLFLRLLTQKLTEWGSYFEGSNISEAPAPGPQTLGPAHDRVPSNEPGTGSTSGDASGLTSFLAARRFLPSKQTCITTFNLHCMS